jgi:diguanylate cyclase
MHRIVQIGYQVRAAAFGYSFLVIGVHLWERNAGAVPYALLALQCIAYPQLVTLAARRARDPKRAELNGQYLDSFLLGAWTAGLAFPIWIAYAACFSTTLNAAVSRGLAGVAVSLVLFSFGALAWAVPAGFVYWGGTSPLVTALCFFGSLAYTAAVGCVVHRQNKERYGRPPPPPGPSAGF